MADDEDVPPLEDMTDVLKQVDALRQQKDGEKLKKSQELANKANTSKAKQKAVVKKNVGGRAVAPEALASGDIDLLSKNEAPSTTTEKVSTPTANPQPSAPTANGTTAANKKPASASGGMFGGMKKGFLFGGPPSAKSSKGPAKTTSSSTPPTSAPKETSSICSQPKKSPTVSLPKPSTEKEADIPYITPTGKTESGLTLDEVQQAMAETKGLLDSQDWINDDLLNKIEGNDLLLKRFADPHFMKALGEFQENPQAALEKYKTNKEVEKFLLEFCGLLGDHFTNLGSSSATQTSTKGSTKSQSPKTKAQPSANPPTMGKAKIVELDETSEKQLKDNDQFKDSVKESNSPKIVEIIDTDSKSSGIENLKTSVSSKPVVSEIKTRQTEAEIQEIPTTEDPDVKAVLSDTKVMEVLLDPQIMSLIQTLKVDPEEGQSLVDKADKDFKEKIQFLVSKGLLQFQNS